jgi:hypothetical protein
MQATLQRLCATAEVATAVGRCTSACNRSRGSLQHSQPAAAHWVCVCSAAVHHYLLCLRGTRPLLSARSNTRPTHHTHHHAVGALCWTCCSQWGHAVDDSIPELETALVRQQRAETEVGAGTGALDDLLKRMTAKERCAHRSACTATNKVHCGGSARCSSVLYCMCRR